MTSPAKPANSLAARLARAEKRLLGLFLMTMILLACIQIALRIFFSSGLPWADPLLRYLVIWTGLLGAARATSQGKHIAMDIVSFLAPPAMQRWLRILISLFSAAVAAALTWSSILFLKSEMQYGSSMLFNVPSWVWNLIFPIAFGLISFRFLITALKKPGRRMPAEKPPDRTAPA